MTTPSVGVRSRVKDQLMRLSVTSAPPSGWLSVEKFGTIASSATAGSSNVRVPGKYRLPAMPCAWAVRDSGGAANARISALDQTSQRAPRNCAATLRSAKPGDGEVMGCIIRRKRRPHDRIEIRGEPLRSLRLKASRPAPDLDGEMRQSFETRKPAAIIVGIASPAAVHR